ncbi:DUF2938 domain-containing protein [Halomonas sp. V046]|uniref:DUF2938 domain-containing protein n=1 Tax=Halomonas sp. V046 TaxID=3459611 RepID=UPI0040442119
MNNLAFALVIGIGATALMDAWGVIRKPLLGAPLPNYAMVGRWIAHMTRGKFRHESIAAAAPVRGEQLIGWTAHYLVGIAFAVLLLSIQGESWIQDPTLFPALAVGIATIAAPFLIMQPGMGAGIAASKTPNPAAARFQSFLTHAVFGLGLYLSGSAAQLLH